MSSARSTFTWAVVGTARTWRGSLGRERGGGGGGWGASSGSSAGSPLSAKYGSSGSGGCSATGSGSRRRRRRPRSDPRGSPRGTRLGVSPAADSPIQPWCSGLEKHSSQTPWRLPPGARNGSVRSPFRMVRPQTSQVTFSWTGRSSFLTSPDDRGPLLRLYGLLLLLGAIDHLLGKMTRDLLVAGELHRVLAPATGDRTQVRRVAQELRHRHLGLDLGHGSLGLHAERTAAAGVEIADHVADHVLGHEHADGHDRLHQHRLGVLH